MNPVVTIAIALYNNEKYVKRCVESVVAQSYDNLDIIIVNDGSTDNSLEIVKKIKDSRIRIIDKQNGGLSSVRQIALDHAWGAFISFIDADDYLLPNYVKILLEKLIKDKSDVCVCGTRFENEFGEPLSYETNSFTSIAFISPLKAEDIDNTKYLFLSDSWNKMYRLQFLRDVNIAFNLPKGLNGTDTSFNMKLFVHNPLYSSIAATGYVHVIYKSSATHRKNKDLIKSCFIITEQIEKECRKKEKIFSTFSSFIYNYYYSFFRFACQDIFNEVHSTSKRIQNTFHVIDEHRSFISNRKYLKKTSTKQSISQIIFVYLLNKCKLLVPLYFEIRNIYILIKRRIS